MSSNYKKDSFHSPINKTLTSLQKKKITNPKGEWRQPFHPKFSSSSSNTFRKDFQEFNKDLRFCSLCSHVDHQHVWLNILWE